MNLSSSLFRLRQFAPVALVLISAAIAVAAYLQALHFPFVSDDVIYIAENTKLAGLHLTELWRLFIRSYNGFSEFLPLRELSFWFDITLFGLNPAAFRLHNILLYLLCLPLTYATTLQLWRYFRPADAASAPWAAAAATALFALHPVLVESVVWVSGRKYVLPNLFSMLALWFAFRARREQRLSVPYAAATLVAFVAAMLAKSSYVTVAPVIALLWIMFWRDIPVPKRRRSQLLWPLAILLLAACQFAIFIAVSGGSGATGIPFYFGVEVVPRTLAVLGWLIRLAVSPETRHFLYPVFEAPSFPAMIALGVTVLAAAVFGMVMLLRKRSLEGFVLVAFVLFCMPYMQLISYLSPSLVQDRYLSIAAWPVMLLLVALAWRLQPVPRTVLLLIFMLSFSYQTMERSRDWRSFEALMDADLRAYPGYYMPATYKAWEVQVPNWLHRDAIKTASDITEPEIRDFMIKLIQADYAVFVDSATTASPHEAMDLLLDLNAILKRPHVQSQWNTPMATHWRGGKIAVESEWVSLAERFPDNALVRYNIGLWMLGVNKYKDAANHLRAAVESQHLPESVRGTAFKSLGLALINSGHVAEAEASLRAALVQQQSDTQAYCLLSVFYKQAKRFEEAAHAEANCSKMAPTEESVIDPE